MYSTSEKRLARLLERGGQGLLAGGLKGLEKESLRVTADGTLADTPHPHALGSPLTHPYITTDFSEALLEFVTPALTDVGATLEFLSNIHRFVYAKLEDEILWATSMPCRVGDDDSVPIARYGTSNRGMMKQIYRRGLRHRYGSLMQTIAGVHFNYSLPGALWPIWREIEGDERCERDLISDAYFRLVRNFQRYGWLVSYLFGSSPAVCKSFLVGRSEGFVEFDRGTWYLPHATSLRMSDIGYKNRNQSEFHVSYDSLDAYVESLLAAIETPFPEYQRIGVKANGEWRQLNANFLQIENEFYSFIRPKPEKGELRPGAALRRGGVRYVEVRALDVSAYDPAGVSEDALRFLEAFLLFCLLEDSPRVGDAEQRRIDENQRMVACCGRDPELVLDDGGGGRSVREWARALVEACVGPAEALQAGASEPACTRALERQLEAVGDPQRLPSARILAEMRATGETFFDFAMRKSVEHERRFQERALPPEVAADLERLARESHERQGAIEAEDDLDFDTFLARYYAER